MPRYTRTHRYPRGRSGGFRRLRQASSAFSPASLSALVLWLDAGLSPLFQNSNGTTAASADADPVGYWGDLSGVGNHVIQATAGKRPTVKLAIQNSLPVLRWDGVDDTLAKASTTLPSAAGLTVCAVVKITTDTNFGQVLSYVTAADHYELRQSGSTGKVQFIAGAGGAGAHSNTDLAGLWGVWVGTYDGVSALGVRLDGVAQTAGTDNGTTGAGSLNIGARADGSLPWNGDIGALVVANSLLSTPVIQQVEAYLKARWGTP